MWKIFKKKKHSKYVVVHGIKWEILFNVGDGFFACVSVSPQHIRNVVVIKIEGGLAQCRRKPMIP